MMSIIVENTADGWVRVSGGPRVIEVTVSTCTVTYGDGRVDADQPCEPYVVKRQIDPGVVRRLIDEGVWSQNDLDELDLKVAVPFVIADGKRTVGTEFFVESNGEVFQQFQIEDLLPVIEPTPDQRLDQMLSNYGLTREEVRRSLLDEDAENA